MKKYLLFLFVLFFVTKSYSQIDSALGVHNIDSCFFATPCELVILNDTVGNLWEIGRPQKPFFDTANIGENALVTDTIAPYAISNSSYFDIPIPYPYRYNFILGFKHKYQTDSLIDGGYIEISADSGITWANVIDEPTLGFASFFSENLYTVADTLKGGINGFSGTSNGWITTRLQWEELPAKPAQRPTGGPDDVILRFHFISDSIQTHKAGWMIDDIMLSYVDLEPGSISEMNLPMPIKIAPNPADDFINISFKNDAVKTFSLAVFNMLGQKVMHLEKIPTDKVRLDISGLQSGMYFIQLAKENRVVSRAKLLKR